MSVRLVGVAASPGLGIGRAVVLSQSQVECARHSIDPGDAGEEVCRFTRAVKMTVKQLNILRGEVAAKLGESEAEIIAAQAIMASDPSLAESVANRIMQELIFAERAVYEACEEQACMLEKLGDEYFAARAADIRDVGRRIIAGLAGVADLAVFPEGLEDGTVLVAKDLAPSEAAAIDVTKVTGIVLDRGGRTSHTAIFACSLGIPAIVGLGNAAEIIKNRDLILVNGNKGEVMINPNADELSKFTEEVNSAALRNKQLSRMRDFPSVTTDGRQVQLAANISGIREISLVKDSGSNGVGLFRTEFLFADRESAPSEDEQFETYKEVLSELAPCPIVIRTLDIGGDKEIPYLKLPSEDNPFLGLRAIRLCLKEKNLFRTQLRALLRASNFGVLRIMFPMVADVSELRLAKRELDNVRTELRAEGVHVAENIEVGIMVEVPSAAVQADVLARECDFFSIGTNDLIQYTMASDRGNPAVWYLNDPFHPAVLRLIARTIEEGHLKGIWVGMCGEMAGNPPAIPLLIGMGIDELSMAPSLVPRVKEIVRELDYSVSKDVWNKVQQMSDKGEIRSYLEDVVACKM